MKGISIIAFRLTHDRTSGLCCPVINNLHAFLLLLSFPLLLLLSLSLSLHIFPVRRQWTRRFVDLVISFVVFVCFFLCLLIYWLYIHHALWLKIDFYNSMSSWIQLYYDLINEIFDYSLSGYSVLFVADLFSDRWRPGKCNKNTDCCRNPYIQRRVTFQLAPLQNPIRNSNSTRDSECGSVYLCDRLHLFGRRIYVLPVSKRRRCDAVHKESDGCTRAVDRNAIISIQLPGAVSNQSGART